MYVEFQCIIEVMGKEHICIFQEHASNETFGRTNQNMQNQEDVSLYYKWSNGGGWKGQDMGKWKTQTKISLRDMKENYTKTGATQQNEYYRK